jgi:hypothetical protein
LPLSFFIGAILKPGSRPVNSKTHLKMLDKRGLSALYWIFEGWGFGYIPLVAD